MSFIKQGALCIDVGAHIGTVSEQLIQAGAGKVIAVEPCLENYKAIVKISVIDGRIIPLHGACWSSAAILEVSYAENEPGWSSVHPEKWSKAYPDAQWAMPELVAGITLDQLIGKFGLPQYIKVDTEGAEAQVLSGLTQKTEFLSFEFHQQFPEDVVKCLEICQALGYKRAAYTIENLDINTVPNTKIGEFLPRFQLDNPKWGQITLRS